MSKKALERIHDLAVVGEQLCKDHKCSDVKMFFRQIKEIVEDERLDIS